MAAVFTVNTGAVASPSAATKVCVQLASTANKTCKIVGKKRLDGYTDRLWVMSNGVVVGGDDVDQFGIDLVRELGPAVPAK